MAEEIDRQSIVDEEHLKLLSLGYMISAGIAACFSLFGLLYVVIGIVMSFAFSQAAPGKNGDAPPAFVGWIFAGVGLLIFLFAIGVAIARYWAGRCIKQRKSRTFCLVIAALGCLEFPYGTAVGVLSFMVLSRKSVIERFTPRPGQVPVAAANPATGHTVLDTSPPSP